MWSGSQEGEWRAPGCARGSASGRVVEGSDEFKYYGDTGYNCMGLYDLHGRTTVSVLACPDELAEVDVR